ncbi:MULTISPECIES: hypothetical protein [unclassified Streptomyces]|uniref:hypothetical protein n=1 Tax=unclassified Streptomyces TaxID=2593676 RepID=UPI00403C4B99
MGAVQGAVPEAAGRGMFPLVEAAPSDRRGHPGRQGMQAAADGFGVVMPVDEVGDGRQVSAQERGRVLALFGDAGGELVPGGFQQVDEFGS